MFGIINKCINQSNLVNLYRNEYSHEFHYYPFSVKLDRYVGSSNTLNQLSNKLCVPSFFNIIIEIH